MAGEDKNGSPKSAKLEITRLKRRVALLEKESERGRQCQADLRRQREFTQTILNSMRDAVYVVSAGEHRITDCNNVFLERYGLTREEVVNRTCHEIKIGENVPCPFLDEDCPSLESFRTGQPAHLERSVQDPQGGVRHYECYTLPVVEDGGSVFHLVHIDRDITARKSAELRLTSTSLELARSYAFLYNIINSSQDAIIAADLKGRILIFNQAASRITGYSEEEALNRLDIRDIYPKGGARGIMRRLRSPDYGGKGRLTPTECVLLTRDGTPVPISLSAAMVTVEEAEVATVGYFYDLREKRYMEEELVRTRTQLMQAEKMASIGKLAAGVAHQINNPLSGITLFGHMLLEEESLSEAAQKDVRRILDNAQRSADTVQELLQFARQTSQEVAPSDINRAVSRTLFLLENQSLFQNIKIVKDLAEGLPDVPADLQQLNHVFMNIILNAADAMAGGGCITVRTRLSDERRFLAVDLEDTGPGLAPENLPHIFEPFYTTKETGKGTGLGISVAYGIIQNHGGMIEAGNLPGGGACFTVKLPVSAG